MLPYKPRYQGSLGQVPPEQVLVAVSDPITSGIAEAFVATGIAAFSFSLESLPTTAFGIVAGIVALDRISIIVGLR